MPTEELIAGATLKELATAGAINWICLVAYGNSFTLKVRLGMSEKLLKAKRGHVRRFKNLNSAASFVRELGISHMEVDVAQWTPRQKSL